MKDLKDYQNAHPLRAAGRVMVTMVIMVNRSYHIIIIGTLVRVGSEVGLYIHQIYIDIYIYLIYNPPVSGCT